jgi:non-specific serine/threonine protein kinase
VIGKTVSHYKIISKLGEGGMGVVYKAEDTRLDRSVAIKFLPPQLSSDNNAKKRFIREAKAASSLNHANIAVVHEIDETPEGQMFMVMACYEGQTLKDRLESGPLGVDEAIAIVSQVASGLSKAHEKGILHRDIKPGNILIGDDGQAKLADFGLATLAGQTKITKTGMTVGTVAYMSPEQARGEKVDASSDIFSLGVVLYELLTGRAPFPGDHEAAVLYGIMHSDPQPVTASREDIPEGLQRIVDTCLLKEATRRYKNAGELVADLNRLRTGVPVSGIVTSEPRKVRRLVFAVLAATIMIVFAGYFLKTQFLSSTSQDASGSMIKVAVLPFDNLGPPDDEYFADGITEAVTARLAVVQGLGVISRQSAVQYKDSDKSLRDIGQELGVEYILEGTVQRERPNDPSSTVRVVPQLIRVSDDMHAWAETYEEATSNVFQVQSEIAGQVARSLGILLLPPELEGVAPKPTEDTEAYEYYLRGKYLDSPERARDYDDHYSAEKMYTEALRRDPEFAAAWAARARARLSLYWDHGEEDVLAEAEADVSRAWQLAPNSIDALMARGFLHYRGYRDYEKALSDFLQVEKHQPNNVEALLAASYVFGRQEGKLEDATLYRERAFELDPRNVHTAVMLAWAYYGNAEYGKADRYFDIALSLDSKSSSDVYEAKALMYLRMGEPPSRAERVLRDGLTRVSPNGWTGTSVGRRLTLIRVLPEIYEQVDQRGEESVTGQAEELLFRAELDRRVGDTSTAVARYDSIRVLLEPLYEADNSNIKATLYLGFAYAGLGLADEAVEKTKAATELTPGLGDYLVWVYVTVGQYDAALDQLEHFHSIGKGYSTGLLRHDPLWDPLRGQPRFTRLLENPADKGK